MIATCHIFVTMYNIAVTSQYTVEGMCGYLGVLQL